MRDAPAGDGRRRFALRTGLAATQDETGYAGRERRELQAAAGGHAHAAHLTHHGGKAGVTQPLFHDEQDLVVAGGIRMQHVIGGEARLCQSRAEHVARPAAPQDGTAEARDNAGGEQGGRTVAAGRILATDLVQCGARQPATRQDIVQSRYVEWQSGGAGRHDATRQMFDPGTQVRRHDARSCLHAPVPCGFCVPILFLLEQQSQET